MSIRHFVLPLIAVTGLLFAVWIVAKGSTPVTPMPPASPSAAAPFKTFVAGAGIIEPSTENIGIGSALSGVVAKVFVKVGDRVKAGEPLIQLDDRAQRSQLGESQASLTVARQQLAKLEAMPRPEDLPPLETRVREAQTLLDDAKSQLALLQSVTDRRAISQDALDRKQFGVDAAQSKLDEARADLASVKAGAWKPELEIARAQLAYAQSQVATHQTEVERLTVLAPVDGTVLQVKIRVGEFAQAGVLAQPMIVIGNVDVMNVRVDIDENDAWRVQSGAQAVAFARGNRDISTKLKFERFEPMVIPKQSLTGASTERVDTRVLQAIFSFDRGALPLYVGQQMDVFIESTSGVGYGIEGGGAGAR